MACVKPTILDDAYIGLSLVTVAHVTLLLERHNEHCKPGFWRIGAVLGMDLGVLLDWPRSISAAVVDDFGTLQVVPA